MNRKGRRLIIYLLPLVLVITSCIKAQDNKDWFKQRAKRLCMETANVYSAPSLSIEDPEKYYWPKVMARFEIYGTRDSLANAWIEVLSNHSPFHFTLVGMARILYLYPEAPSVRKNTLLILRKVFERADSYNAFTGEGTENHVSMSRTSAYLYAQAALQYPKEFPGAKMKLDSMKSWIMLTSKRIFTTGAGEWNSSIYETYNLIGWLNLFDFARDKDVQFAARAALDYYACEMAISYSWGTIGGSEMRGTGVQDRNTNSMNALCWLWFGPDSLPPFSGSQYIQCMHAVTSRYYPPQILLTTALKKRKPEQYLMSRPAYLLNQPSFVKQIFYTDSSFTLGSSISAYGGWTGSTYQIVPWKLVVRPEHNQYPYEISGNGRFYDEWSGKTVNPFTQVIQFKNVLFLMTCLPSNVEYIINRVEDTINIWKSSWEKDFHLRFPLDTEKVNPIKANKILHGGNQSYLNFPKSACIRKKGNLIYAGIGKVLVLIHSLSGSAINYQGGRGKEKERIILSDQADTGKLCGFVIEVIGKDKYSSDKSVENMSSVIIKDSLVNYISCNGDSLTAIYHSSGSFSEGTVDWGYGPTKQQVFIDPALFRQPQWPTGRGFGRIPELLAGKKLVDFKAIWPVIQGSDILLKDNRLIIEHGNSFYEINYKTKIPVFRSAY